MARSKGSSSFVSVPLSTLVAALSGTPNIKIKVGRTWLAAVEEVHNVNLGAEAEGDAPEAEAAAATASTPSAPATFEVEEPADK